MSLLGIDLGTTGCKAAAFTEDGRQLSLAYDEYDVQRPHPGWAELDPAAVWKKICGVVRKSAADAGRDAPRALAVSSFGEAMVPVSASREVLGPSILNYDIRGLEHLAALGAAIPAADLYRINGNTLANFFGLPKLAWIRDNQPELYRGAYKFLLWGSFVPFMLGADPKVDYSLANRTLLFDLDRGAWSDWIAGRAAIDLSKLPEPVPSGTVIGQVSRSAAEELGLKAGLPIAAGSHDQCANAVGAGVVTEGSAMCGMGTFLCLVPAFSRRPDTAQMLSRGLNTEHHAVPGQFVSFLYNYGGVLLKWFRDTFARLDKERAAASGQDIYDLLIKEIPAGPSPVFVLPRFAQTGPPDFSPDPDGVIAGLSLETTRGDICKAIMEGAVFHIRELVESIAEAGVPILELRAVGGGSKSPAWVQLTADILGIPMVRPRVTEAGSLGAAIAAGVGCGAFKSFADGAARMVQLVDRFEPAAASWKLYEERYRQYRGLWPAIKGWPRR
jgi:xylulokinase